MDKADKAYHAGLLKLVNDADFTLKAREVGTFIDVYKWVKELPAKFEEYENKIKDLEKKLASLEKPKTTRKKKNVDRQ
jgi:uncharacterized coiled-coil DUF342 family protein